MSIGIITTSIKNFKLYNIKNTKFKNNFDNKLYETEEYKNMKNIIYVNTKNKIETKGDIDMTLYIDSELENKDNFVDAVIDVYIEKGIIKDRRQIKNIDKYFSVNPEDREHKISVRKYDIKNEIDKLNIILASYEILLKTKKSIEKKYIDLYDKGNNKTAEEKAFFEYLRDLIK